MADEVIILDVDPTEALRGTERANRSLSILEQRAARTSAAATGAATAESERVVRVIERSRQSVERLVTTAERRAAFAGKSGVERLEVERSQLLSRIAGDERAIDRVRAAYDKLIAAENAGNSAGGVGGILGKLRNPLEAAGQAVEGFLDKFGKVGVVAAGAAAGLALAAKAGFDLVSSAGAQAETVSNLADRLGITASQAYRLKIQAEGVGLGVEALETAYRGLSAAIEDGTQEGKRGAEALSRLGVRVVETDGRVRGASDFFRDLGDSLGRIENPAERARRAIDIFSKGGLSLLPFLLSFRETEEAAKRAAAGIEDPLITALAKADDKIDETRAKWESLKLQLAGKIVAAVEYVEKVRGNVPEAASVSAFLNAARGRGPASTTPRFVGPAASPENLREADRIQKAVRAADESAGLRIVEAARRRQALTDEGLRDQLTEAVRRRQEAFAKLQPGLGPEAARERSAALDAAIRDENRLKAAIEARAKAQRDAEEFTRSREQLSTKLPEFLRSSEQRSRDSLREEGLRVLQIRAEAQRQADEFRRETESIRRATSTAGGATEQLAQEEGLRAAQLRRIDEFNARTVGQKIDVENKKAAIEEESLIRMFRIRANLLDAEAQQEIDAFEVIARARGIQEEEIGARRAAIIERYATQARELEIRTTTQIEDIQADAARRSAELQIAEQERVFERFRSGFESLLDQLFSRARSSADVGKSLLTAFILTPLKQSAAELFAQVATGQARTTSARSGLGGLFGGLFGRLGSGGAGGLIPAGAPGGTPGFAGPVGSGPVPSSAVRGGLGQFAAIGAAQRAGLLEFLGIGGSIQTGAGTATTFGAATLAQRLGAIGRSNAALAAGGLLAFDGLRRGGALGLAETTGGGALIGFRLGGPLGAAIGAGAGAIAGTIRLFVKGAQEKIVEKVRSLYGISISKEFARDPLLGIIKQQFGGNIDVGIRSAQVRDLIELYGMSTGAGNGPLSDRVRPLSFRDTGRGLQEIPGFFNGQPRLTVGAASSSAPVVIQSVQLVVGGDSAAAFMQGQIAPVVADSPNAVASALQTANKLSIGRRDLAAAQLGMVTA